MSLLFQSILMPSGKQPPVHLGFSLLFCMLVLPLAAYVSMLMYSLPPPVPLPACGFRDWIVHSSVYFIGGEAEMQRWRGWSWVMARLNAKDKNSGLSNSQACEVPAFIFSSSQLQVSSVNQAQWPYHNPKHPTTALNTLSMGCQGSQDKSLE